MNAEAQALEPIEEPARRFRLTPLTRRRWANFKAHKRGYWSLWLFVTLYVVSLCAELVANDRPLLIWHKSDIYAPAFVGYPETVFGGQFETEADYSDPAVQRMIADHGWAIWPIIPYSYETIDYDIGAPLPGAPSGRHWLGTDDQGRDVLARLIYGFRLSVTFGLLLTIFSSVIGIMAGAIQGFFGGWTDLLLQRAIEIFQSLPLLYLLIIVSTMVQPGFFTLLGVLLLFSWMALVRVVRAEFLRARNLEYVRAARALGLRNSKIMFKHILPNAMVATITFVPFVLNASITTLTSLDFLGFGLPRGSPSLGELLSQARNNLNAPWLGVSGFMVMAIMLSLLIFIGEAVRDAFDPRRSA
jgi:microcin C transport system permease protein